MLVNRGQCRKEVKRRKEEKKRLNYRAFRPIPLPPTAVSKKHTAW